MPDLSKTIEIIFAGNDKVSDVVKGIDSSFSKIESSAMSLAAPLAKVADAALAADASLAALVVGGLGYAINQFAGFEDTMLKVKGVMGASEEEYQNLTALTQKLGETTRYTAKEAAQGLEFLGLSGMSVVEAMSALPAVLELAQASGMELKGTADIVTNIMAGFAIEAEELGRVNDILTATFTNSNTSLEQLGAAFKYVGPVAESMGFSIEETSAALGVLGNAGYQAEQGGTALRNIMIALVAPAGNTAKLMKELGVNTHELGIDLSSSSHALNSLGVTIKDASGNVRPFSDIVKDLKTGIEQIQDPADRTAILIEIFGKRGGPQMAALLSQGAESLTDLEGKIDSLGGITKKIAVDMESGMGGIKRAIFSAFDSIFLAIGEKAADAIEEGAGGAVDLLRAIAAEVRSDTFQPVFNVLEEFGDQIGETISAIAQNVPKAMDGVDFDGLIKAFDNLSDSVGGILSQVDLKTPEGLRSAVQGIIETIASLLEYTKGMVDGFTPFIESIQGAISSFNELSPELKAATGEMSALAKAIVEIGPKFTAVILAISSAANDLAPVFKVVINTISGSLDAVASIWNMLKLGVFEIIDDLLQAGKVFSDTFLFGAFSDDVQANIEVVRKWKIQTEKALYDAASSATEKLTGIKYDFNNLSVAAGDTSEKIGEIPDKINEIPELSTFDIQAQIEQKEFDDFWTKLVDMGNIDPTQLKVIADAESLGEVEKDLEELSKTITTLAEIKADTIQATQTLTVWSEKQGLIEIEAPVDTKEIDKAQKKIEALPTEKQLEIKLQGDIDKQIETIKAEAETVQAAMEWTAKLEIANVEAQTKQIESAYGSINTAIESTGDVISSALSTLSTADDLQTKWAALETLESEADYREESLKMQKELNEAQVAYLKARKEALAGGDVAIKITMDGAEPAVEKVMWEIIKKAHAKGTEQAADFLLGIV